MAWPNTTFKGFLCLKIINIYKNKQIVKNEEWDAKPSICVSANLHYLIPEYLMQPGAYGDILERAPLLSPL